MAKPTLISQGGSVPFTFDRDGESIQGWVATIYVKQFINHDAVITRELEVDPDNATQWAGELLSDDTAELNLGLWHIFANLKNVTTGEARQVKSGPVRFEILKTVVSVIETFFRITAGAGDFRVTAGAGDNRVTQQPLL